MSASVSSTPAPLATLVIHPWQPQPKRAELLRTPEDALAEACALARALGLQVGEGHLARLNQPNPALLIGQGTANALAERISAEQIGLVIINHALSPVQQRNLEQLWRCKVIDRTGLILEIFGDRARTAEGQLQVELAALDYQRSRLVRSWTHLERQRGGFGFLGGPGESQLEIDRRLIEQRMTRIRRDLEKVRQTRELQRQQRLARQVPLIALVGYTNAGKSTLFNQLTGAGVLAKDMLFATLDPTVRQVRLPSGQQAVLSDTVGFISDLPHQLVAAFRATLEEVELADLILHVRDSAAADSEAQKTDVHETLAALGIDPENDPRVVEVLNKIDLLPPDERPVILADKLRRIGVSAISGEGVSELMVLIEQHLNQRRQLVRVELPHSDGQSLAWLHAHGAVVSREETESSTILQVLLTADDFGRWQHRQKAG